MMRSTDLTGLPGRIWPGVLIVCTILCGIQADRPEVRAQATSLEEQMEQHLKHDFFQLNLLIQSRMRYSLRNTGFQGGRTFQVPNARIGARGELNDNFHYRIQFNFANSPALMDAYIGWRFSDYLNIQGGAMKPRVSTDFIPNPALYDFIDRSRIPSYFNLSRQLGVAVSGTGGGYSWYAGIFNGNGLNNNNNNVFDLQARLDKSIPIGAGSLDIGLNGIYGEVTTSPPGMIGSVERVVLGADARFDNGSVLLAGEYMTGFYESVTFDDSATLQAYYATAGFYPKSDLLVLGRWQQWFHSENAGHEGSQITMGFKKFLTSTIIMDLNLDAWFEDTIGSDTQMGFSANVSFLF